MADAAASTKASSTRAAMINGGDFNRMLKQENFAVWTINDQQRLLALDALHDRLLSYHNNIHVKDSKLDRTVSTVDGSLGPDSDPGPNVIVGQVVRFSDSPERFPISYEQLPGFVRQLHKQAASETPGSGFTWLHLRDQTAVDLIAADLGIHDLLAAGFSDFRAHSSLLPGNSEMLLSLVTSVLEANDCNMYKLFIYVNSFIVITCQVELLPDLTNITAPNPDLIVESLLENHGRLLPKCRTLGPIYLMYELALKALRMADSSLEFISCALSYFNRIVHLNLLHRERLDLRIKLDMIASGVLFMKRSVDETRSLCATLLQLGMDQGSCSPGSVPAGAGLASGYDASAEDSFSSSPLFNNTQFNPNAATYMKKYTKHNLATIDYNAALSAAQLRKVLYGDLMAVRHLPYLVDLCDAYGYIHTCLHTEFEETVRLQAELDGTIQLRTSNTSLVLSLIATVFLPLTFLAGVFGMNFQEGADYTMALLNERHGPTAFAMMCLACFLCIFTFFVYQGWIEVGIFATVYKSLHQEARSIDDSSKTAGNSRAVRRAEEEEQRRREQTALLRNSMALAARGRSSVIGSPSMTGSIGGGSIGGRRVMSPLQTST